MGSDGFIILRRRTILDDIEVYTDVTEIFHDTVVLCLTLEKKLFRKTFHGVNGK